MNGAFRLTKHKKNGRDGRNHWMKVCSGRRKVGRFQREMFGVNTAKSVDEAKVGFYFPTEIGL